MNRHQELIINYLHGIIDTREKLSETDDTKMYAAIDLIKSMDIEYLSGREEELTKQLREYIRAENILM